MTLVVSSFPGLDATDLLGREVRLPAAFDGDRNVVIVAFRRQHQAEVDSWVPWLEARAADDPALRFYELPTISDLWSPARRFIDGGMATAIGDPVVLARTLTIYGDVTRLTDPLGIDDRSTIWLFVVDRKGRVRAQASGRFDPAVADELAAALERVAVHADPDDNGRPTVQFSFAFDPRFRPLLALAGITPEHAHVTVTADRLIARYGPWSLETPLDNVAGVQLSHDYHWYKAIGPRGSFADRGLTFGTNTRAGVCVCFHRPVPGLEPFGLIRHPGVTLTVDDPDALAAVLRDRLTTT